MLRDTVELREFVLATLRTTCFLGCELTRVRRRADVPDPDSPFLRPAAGDGRKWQLPRTYAWQNGGGALVEFALFSPGQGVYGVHAEWNGNRFWVSIDPIARFVAF